ncbi:MAG: hypothetical protein IID16_08380 [Candidatus Marinimicrobia bacterium]|nr:hypothetical protein [Candidatus Neomarinimicrobiota bacterium]
MYKFYLIVHFLLMMIWIVSAFILDFRFLMHFRKLGNISQIGFLKSIQKVSDKTEFPASFFIILMGVLMIIDQTHWLKVGIIYWKIVLALTAIGLYHASRSVLKKMILSFDSNESVQRLANRYIIFRLSTFVFLISIFWIIIEYKGGISTIHILKSWF